MEVSLIVKKIGYLYSTSAETPTGFELAKEQVKRLKVNWSNPGLKFLDPACGRGTYLLAIAERLEQAGHSRKHIVQNMLYGIDISKVQSMIATKALAMFGGDSTINIVTENTLEKAWDMKFDVIMGNPPYNREIKIENTPLNAGYIYIQFIIDSLNNLNDNGTLNFVLPSNWLTLKKFSKFRKWLSTTYQIDSLHILENLKSQKYFDAGTDIVVIQVTNKTPSAPTQMTFEFGAPWTVDLTSTNIWPLFTSKEEHDAYFAMKKTATRFPVLLSSATKMNLSSGKGYVSGTVVIGDKTKDLSEKWVVNQRLPIRSEHSLNNQWALEFESESLAHEYIAYAKTDKYRTFIKNLIPGFKLQPYLLQEIGF